LSPFKNLTDDEILSLVKQDDEKAFAELFDRYWKKIHVIAYSKLRSRASTQEIVQDIFFDLWQRRHSLQVTNFASYMNVSVKYKIINHFKRVLIKERYDHFISINGIKSGEETLKVVEYNELVEALEKVLHKFPSLTQTIFRLNRLEGKSISEIARSLDLSEKAIQYHITKSVKELKLHMKHFLSFVISIILFQ
jgi:RNA polymerase sigma factor (sigma-70 family)